MAEPLYSPEMRRIQAALALFAVLWEGAMCQDDLVRHNWVYGSIEAVTALICLVLSWMIAQGKIRLGQLGHMAMLLVTVTLVVVMVDDVTAKRMLSTYTYVDATIMLGLAFAFFGTDLGIPLAVVMNLSLALGTWLTPVRDLSLVAGEVFISALFVYISLHNRHVLLAQRQTQLAQAQIAEMVNHDPATGLRTKLALQLHLRQWWPQTDEIQKAQAALVVVTVADFQQLTRTLGSEAGNQVLQKVAVHLIQGSDLRDIVSRGDGPTFLMFLLNVRRRDVLARMEELTDRLHGPLWLGGPRISLVSGFAMLSEGESPEACLYLALSRCEAALQPPAIRWNITEKGVADKGVAEKGAAEKGPAEKGPGGQKTEQEKGIWELGD